MKTIFAAVLLAAITTQASAGYLDGNKLHDVCRKQDDAAGPAMLYALGVVDGVSDLGSILNLEKLKFCMPEGVTARQLGDVVCLFLQNSPGDRQSSAASLVMGAVLETWPCE